MEEIYLVNESAIENGCTYAHYFAHSIESAIRYIKDRYEMAVRYNSGNELMYIHDFGNTATFAVLGNIKLDITPAYNID